MKFDIAIIGGGVAGLSTALYTCSEIDATILLFEKGKIGDATKTSPFTFPDTVERYGLDDAVLQNYTRFSYRSPSGISASFEYDETVYVTLDYEKLCNIMADRLKKEGNVRILEETEVIDFDVENNFLKTRNIELRLSNSRNFNVGVLVDASGKAFFTAKKLGTKLPPLYSHPYGELLEGCHIDDPKEMYIFSGNKYGNGGGWLYPINKRTARFGFATVTRSSVYPMFVVRQNFINARENFKPYSEMIANSKSVRKELGTIPLGALKKFVFDSILIVGDAAGQATPWYCEGIRPALEAGEICGKTICEAYRKKNWSKGALKKYQKKWDALNRKLYSKNAKIGFRSWFRTQKGWDAAVRHAALHTPKEMVRRVRYSKP